MVVVLVGSGGCVGCAGCAGVRAGLWFKLQPLTTVHPRVPPRTEYVRNGPHHPPHRPQVSSSHVSLHFAEVTKGKV